MLFSAPVFDDRKCKNNGIAIKKISKKIIKLQSVIVNTAF